MPDYLDIFTKDALLDARTTAGRVIHDEHGHKDLAASFNKKKFPPDAYDKHLMHQPIISVNGAEARVEAYYSFYNARRDGHLLVSYGRYKDTLVKEPDGRWRIKERIVTGEGRV